MNVSPGKDLEFAVFLLVEVQKKTQNKNKKKPKKKTKQNPFPQAPQNPKEANSRTYETLYDNYKSICAWKYSLTGCLWHSEILFCTLKEHFHFYWVTNLRKTYKKKIRHRCESDGHIRASSLFPEKEKQNVLLAFLARSGAPYSHSAILCP